MKSLVHHPVDLSAPQMRKLMGGGAITLKPSQFREGARTSVSVLPATARRIATAMRKMKGVRVSLKPDEDLLDVETGGSLKSFGRTLKRGITKGASEVGDALTSRQAMNTYKQLGHYGVDIGIPILAGVAGEMLGGPAGAAAGSALGSVAADRINRSGYGIAKGMRRVGAPKGARLAYDDVMPTKGKGFFKAVKRITGVNKTAIIKTAKKVGKEFVDAGAEIAGEAITAYTGNPMLGAVATTAIKKGGNKAIDSGSVRKGLKASGGAATSLAKDLAIEYADDYIDKNLTGAEKKVAQKALAGKYPSAKDLIYDYGDTKMEKFSNTLAQPIGGGRLLSMPKIGMGSPYVSAPYRRAMRPMIGDAFVGGSLMSVRPMSDLQTLSPVASVYSPQMSPFIPDKSPQMSVSLRSKSGGSFLPAGYRTYGGSFVPAGM
jgi:hypothetical protein